MGPRENVNEGHVWPPGLEFDVFWRKSKEKAEKENKINLKKEQLFIFCDLTFEKIQIVHEHHISSV